MNNYRTKIIGSPSIGLSNTSINVSTDCIVALGLYVLSSSVGQLLNQVFGGTALFVLVTLIKTEYQLLNIYSLIIELFATTL